MKNQNELEAIRSLIAKSYKELGHKLDIVDESIVLEHSVISCKDSLREVNKISKLLDVLDEIKE